MNWGLGRRGGGGEKGRTIFIAKCRAVTDLTRNFEVKLSRELYRFNYFNIAFSEVATETLRAKVYVTV